MYDMNAAQKKKKKKLTYLQYFFNLICHFVLNILWQAGVGNVAISHLNRMRFIFKKC